MDRYPSISNHGLIGDLQTAALVSGDGTVDWFCCPRFDSPSIFASLLDADRGGHFRMAPDRDDYVSKQLYLPDTAILITRFMTPDGVGEVHDFMPVTHGAATGRHRLVRQLKVVRGTMRFAMDLQPRFGYGRDPHTLDLTDSGALFSSRDTQLAVHPIGQPGTSASDVGVSLERHVDGLRWTRTLREGQTGGVVIESTGEPPHWVTPEEADRLAAETAQFWRGWLGRSAYTGRWREMVTRSAMTLKLMTYAPSGGIVAAPTAGLPEQVGGERNWDYRYTWVRDGSFSVFALLGLGYLDEAAAFATWLRDRAAERTAEAGHPLKIMYRVDGSSDLTEDVGGDGPRTGLGQPGLPVNPAASPDGLAGDEGTFSLCTFWYVDALARSGRLEEARLTFEKMFTYANHLGLYSEEISATGEQLGNFPQAFSHLSLISAAVNLDHQLDHGTIHPARG